MTKILGYQGIKHHIHPGDKIKVKKGTQLWSTHPDKKGWYENNRTRNVIVDHVICGMSVPKHDVERYYMESAEHTLGEDLLLEMLENANNYDLIPVHNPRVVWSGSGRYWVECDINDVEIVEEGT